MRSLLASYASAGVLYFLPAPISEEISGNKLLIPYPGISAVSGRIWNAPISPTDPVAIGSPRLSCIIRARMRGSSGIYMPCCARRTPPAAMPLSSSTNPRKMFVPGLYMALRPLLVVRISGLPLSESLLFVANRDSRRPPLAIGIAGGMPCGIP